MCLLIVRCCRGHLGITPPAPFAPPPARTSLGGRTHEQAGAAPGQQKLDHAPGPVQQYRLVKFAIPAMPPSLLLAAQQLSPRHILGPQVSYLQHMHDHAQLQKLDVTLAYRFDSQLMHSRNPTHEELMWILLYADQISLVCDDINRLRMADALMDSTFLQWGLTI